MSGRCCAGWRISCTPAAKTNSDKSALYTLGSGLSASCNASVMPLSAAVTWSAFSAEKHTPPRLMSMPLPSSRRSLSLAVTTAQRLPARDRAASMVGARSHLGSFIMTSVPVSTSYRKLPQMPCTLGGTPVTMLKLFGLVKVGTTQSAMSAVPPSSPAPRRRLSQGMWPPATACAR